MSLVALVVDDSALIRHTVRRCLEERGFEVQCAANGREALEVLTRVRPNVVITDLQMPDMSGSELITALKNKPETVSIPLVVLTSHQGQGSSAEKRANFAIYKGVDIDAQLGKALGLIMGTQIVKKQTSEKKQ